MKHTYCGACRGERGCADCKAAAVSAVYTGLTEFTAADISKEVGCGKEELSTGGSASSGAELFLAADLGTTTLAFVCANKEGKVLASYGAENPQRKVATDVIGRIDAALSGQSGHLTKIIREALVKGFLFVFSQAMKGLEDAEKHIENPKVRIAVAGNTVMQHLLLGYPVDGMAKSPFIPYALKSKTFRFDELFAETAGYEEVPEPIRKAELIVFPCFSAFVGGDVAAGATALFEHRENQTCLLMDLGTNGELLLLHEGKVYGTAAAMGCAFEGGRYAYASDLFSLIGQALEEGIMDETGLLCEPYFTEGFHGLLQEDVREFQLAKGAVRAGIELLCNYAGITPSGVKHVFAAGSIGRFCREEDFIRTGLLPRVFEGKIRIVGNSCIGGLLRYFKNPESVLYWEGEILNLAELPEFSEVYYRYMNFEAEEEADFERASDRKDGLYV